MGVDRKHESLNSWNNMDKGRSRQVIVCSERIKPRLAGQCDKER